MIIGSVFDILVTVVFAMSPHIGGIGPKYQKLVTQFQPIEGESLPNFYLLYLQARS